jgi:cytochrome c-type protein NapB
MASLDNRYRRIFVLAVAMAAIVFIFGGIARRVGRPLPEPSRPVAAAVPIESEAAMFALSDRALALKESTPAEKNTKRTLASFYASRAFPGAPPPIPHPLLEDRSMGGGGCLGCHRDGGFVPIYKAYAPVTPHPQYGNCRQCHVGRVDGKMAASGPSQPALAPAINQEALKGGPPPIPHGLQMRENCLACHAGPAAVAEIRTPHPERVNCRQCHASASDAAEFRRPVQ